MSALGKKRASIVALCAVLLALVSAPGAAGAFDDPLFVFVPEPKVEPPKPPQLIPLPTGYLNGPCGIAVDSSGRFYVSDYYHRAVDVFKPPTSPYISPSAYVGQLPNVDPLDGPCAIALDASNNLYVEDFHRRVARYGPAPSFVPGPVFDTAQAYPAGIAVDSSAGRVYVNERTHIGVYDLSGVPVLDGGQPLRIGVGALTEGYGLALSKFPATSGYLYVADAATDTVEVYDPATDPDDPVATIAGPPGKEFVSLRDAALAVDWQSGELYVADNTQPHHAEEPRALVHVFGPVGDYEGHLKYTIVDARPPGLAVDNSPEASQGRVYVTSGNTTEAGLYAYPPGAATTSDPLPPVFSFSLSAFGAGAITSGAAGIECASACEPQIRAGRQITLRATPEPGSAFLGWSGEECSGTGTCTVVADEPLEVSARFAPLAGPPAPRGKTDPSPPLRRSPRRAPCGLPSTASSPRAACPAPARRRSRYRSPVRSRPPIRACRRS